MFSLHFSLSTSFLSCESVSLSLLLLFAFGFLGSCYYTVDSRANCSRLFTLPYIFKFLIPVVVFRSICSYYDLVVDCRDCFSCEVTIISIWCYFKFFMILPRFPYCKFFGYLGLFRWLRFLEFFQTRFTSSCRVLCG